MEKIKHDIINLSYQILFPVLLITAIALLFMPACQKLDVSTITKSNIVGVTIEGIHTVNVEVNIFDLSDDVHPDYGVCYSSVNQFPTISDSKVSKGILEIIKKEVITIQDLQPEIKIYVRAFVMNGSNPQYSFNVMEAVIPLQSSFIDSRNGWVYQTIIIGEQCWMAENLTFLPVVGPSSEGSETLPYYYVYGYEGTNVGVANSTHNHSFYGVLYNGPAALTACPEGWHLPTDTEWEELQTYLGGYSIAGGKMKSTGTLEAGTGLWYEPNAGATNSSGFSGLPGGLRNPNGSFELLGSSGYWWSSTQSHASSYWFYYLHDYSVELKGFPHSGSYGFSVRCIRN